MLNKNIAEGKWKELKGEIQKAWGNIKGDELEKSKGDLNSIAGIIQKKYGIAQEDARARLKEMASRTSKSLNLKSEDLKRAMAETAKRAKESLKRTERPRH
jgi:uncharacterized protein YjbJ (UPF0337 family)